MAIEILYGQTLKEKNTYLFDKIHSDITENKKVLYIVPEQFAFTADMMVLFNLGEKHSHLTQTINFKRMAETINSKYSQTQAEYMTEEVKNLILQKILRSNISKIKTIKKRGNSPDSILIFKDILSQFKSEMIDAQTLNSIKSSLAPKSFLYQKINDLQLILEEYDKYIENNYKDYEDSFLTLSKNILNNNLYADYEVYIDNFIHFSKSEYSVIFSILKNAKNIHITLLCDTLKDAQKGELFYITYQTYCSFKKYAFDNSLEILETCIDTTTDNIIKNVFYDIFDNTKKSDVEIVVTNANTRSNEIRNVVLQIKNLIFSGATYNDICILCGDISKYEDALEVQFQKSQIPFFSDKKISLKDTPICKLFISAFDMYISDFSTEETSVYLKNLCFIFNQYEEFCLFEQFINTFRLEKDNLKNDVSWNKSVDIIKKGNTFLISNIEVLNSIRNKFIRPVAIAFENIKNQNKSEDYTKAFSTFMNLINFQNILSAYLEKENDFDVRQTYTNAYNTLIKVISNIETLLKDEIIAIVDYFIILSMSLDVYKVGILPNSLDKVTISDLQRGRDNEKKYVFIIGLNEGITPINNENIGFLSDIELETISEACNVELPTCLWKNNSSYLALYRGALLPTKILYISKSDFCDDTTPLAPSFMWDSFKMHSNCYTEFQCQYANKTEAAIVAISENLNEYTKTNENNEFFQILNDIPDMKSIFDTVEKTNKDNYFSQDKKVDKKIINTKYQKKLSTSVSRIETYRKCAYSYFVRYLLNVQKNDNVDFDFAKTGILVHKMIDKFSKLISDKKISWENVSEEFINDNLPKIALWEIENNFSILNRFSPKAQYLLNKLTRTAKTTILYIKEHFISGEFVPMGYEIPIGENGVSPLSIALEDGSIIEIYGQVDRGDSYFDVKNDTLYIRIIDYKSSQKQIDFAMVKEGIQIQLLTYLDTLIKNGKEYFDFSGKIMPGAAFYMAFDQSLTRFENEPTTQELTLKIKEKFMLKGVVLNNDNLIRAIDRELEDSVNYNSEIIDVKTNNDGTYSLKSLLYENQFEKLLSDCEKIVKNVGTEILDGEFYMRPYQYGNVTACDYCDFKGVCQFDKLQHRYKKIYETQKDDYFTDIDRKEKTD